MELGAREIHQKQFHDAWRGYNQEEVDDFLDRVAETMERLQRDNQALLDRVRQLEHNVASSRESEEVLKKTLVGAQQTAEEAIAKARTRAEQVIAEAEERARRAQEEARQRAAAVETDIRQKTVDADREFAERKRALQTEIDRLRKLESEIKQRLSTFLDQQRRALDALNDQPARSPAPAQQPTGQPAQQGARPPVRAAAVDRPPATSGQLYNRES